jgi:hypothetical protein
LGKGSLTFDLPVVQAATLDVSRALHKVAYLTLAVACPQLAFSSSLDHVRRYLSSEDPSYKAYGERLRPGSPPGASVVFCMQGEFVEQDVVQGREGFVLIRIHHAEYLVPLFGPTPSGPPSLFPGLHWYPDPIAEGTRAVTVAFQIEGE